MWIDTRKFADKFINPLSDNRVLPSQWKYAIPMFIVQQPITVVINARNFADGIIHNIEKYGIDIPIDKLAYDEFSKDFMLE